LIEALLENKTLATLDVEANNITSMRKEDITLTWQERNESNPWALYV
jgi:hypothetical protein